VTVDWESRAIAAAGLIVGRVDIDDCLMVHMDSSALSYGRHLGLVNVDFAVEASLMRLQRGCELTEIEETFALNLQEARHEIWQLLDELALPPSESSEAERLWVLILVEHALLRGDMDEIEMEVPASLSWLTDAVQWRDVMTPPRRGRRHWRDIPRFIESTVEAERVHFGCARAEINPADLRPATGRAPWSWFRRGAARSNR
jgi:hypothetical protein